MMYDAWKQRLPDPHGWVCPLHGTFQEGHAECERCAEDLEELAETDSLEQSRRDSDG